MQGFPTQEQVKRIREQYPVGTRIELDGMDNERDMPPGLKGTVKYVDDAGQLGMAWDSGRSLALIPGEDRFHIIRAEEQAKENDILVLVVEPGKAPYEQRIENDFRSFQQLVNGSIEFVSLPEPDCHIYCNDGGKLDGLPGNRKLDNGDILCGTFVICADDGEGGEVSLNAEQIQRYKERFQEPEIYTDEEAHRFAYEIGAPSSTAEFLRMLGLIEVVNDTGNDLER